MNHSDIKTLKLKTHSGIQKINRVSEQDLINKSGNFEPYLKGYKKVEDLDEIDNIELGSKIRYITKYNQFRLGGILKKNNYPEWLYLQKENSIGTWTVKIENQKEIYYISKKQMEYEKKLKQRLYDLYQNKKIVTYNEYYKLNEKYKELKDDYNELLYMYNSLTT